MIDITFSKWRVIKSVVSILISIVAVQAANMVVVTSRVKIKVMILTVWIELIFFITFFPQYVGANLFWNQPHLFLELLLVATASL